MPFKVLVRFLNNLKRCPLRNPEDAVVVPDLASWACHMGIDYLATRPRTLAYGTETLQKPKVFLVLPAQS